ncbi:Protein CBG17855 [Caenorhabditis briggsae]|uniref:Protein CBG17855 n=1 Tax=Caenorhabditis briggsae TaxID=6238 RepID=A8XRX4_CAEBR|nr:Protein CBG17855 [Caenorhabditis briggsae]CAP35400.1 Protein CBG17855 [Caenorhabditis briggsae]
MPEITNSNKMIEDETYDILRKKCDYLIFVTFSFLVSSAIKLIFSVIDGFRNVKSSNTNRFIAYTLLFFEFHTIILFFLFNCNYYLSHFTKIFKVMGNLWVMILFMPIWYSIHIFANGFGALVLWKISNLKRDYYEDDIYLVIYGGEESSRKKMEINKL